MASFSVFITDCRNGDQREVLLQGFDSADQITDYAFLMGPEYRIDRVDQLREPPATDF